MTIDVLIHFMLEALGGVGYKCILGLCAHDHPVLNKLRIPLWIVYGLICSFITVHLVG